MLAVLGLSWTLSLTGWGTPYRAPPYDCTPDSWGLCPWLLLISSCRNVAGKRGHLFAVLHRKRHRRKGHRSGALPAWPVLAPPHPQEKKLSPTTKA